MGYARSHGPTIFDLLRDLREGVVREPEPRAPPRRPSPAPEVEAPAPPLDTLEGLAAAAWRLEVPMPHERRGIIRHEGARVCDRLLARVARGRGALDVAIGERLDALCAGDRLLKLGCAGLDDYARERLGIAGRTALDMAKLARELRDRPLLAAAVRSGEVSARKALAVLALARGEDEARWVERARADTVRGLLAAAKAEAAALAAARAGAAGETGGAGGTGAGGEGAPGEGGAGAVSPAAAAAAGDERWERVTVFMKPEERRKLEEAIELAGRVLGATAPRWQRLEAICQEYLGAHPAPEGEGEVVVRSEVSRWLEAVKAHLEVEMRRWWFLEEVPPVAAPAPSAETDPFRLDEELRELAATADRWNELVGHLALLVRHLGLWREMGFADFSHYCAERLGMAERTVEQRIALERRLYSLPALRKAMREGRVSYEKAKVLAFSSLPPSEGRGKGDGGIEAWIARAEKTSCVELRRAVEAPFESPQGGAQMCAPGDLDLRVPRQVADLLDAAMRAARAASERWLGPGECLERIAAHFVDAWKDQLPPRRALAHRVVDRDEGRCQVPGCSRAAAHAHHIRFRSAGGGDEPSNLVSLCAAHHLYGVHRGYVRVSGRAPGALRWELGLRPGRPPLVVAGAAA